MAGKLTKAQKELLELMKADSAYYISKWYGESRYYLKRGDEFIKTLRYDMLKSIKPYLVESYKNHYEIYRFRPDAEISETWREAELERRRQASIDKEQAERAAIEAEQQKAVDWREGQIIDCGCYAVPVNNGQRFYHCELHAAAPDLLAALEGLLSVVNVRIDDPRTAQFDAARAAIAKAKGQ